MIYKNGNYINTTTKMRVNIIACESTIIGNNPDSVTDFEIHDMFQGIAPEGWVDFLDYIKGVR